jgi:cytochrome c553
MIQPRLSGFGLSGKRSIAIIFAAAAVLASPADAAGDRALGEYFSSECVTCHQRTGRFAGIPPIVGWPEETFVAVMNEYKLKRRPNPVMQTLAGRLSDEEIAALAAYFGSLAVQPAAQ